MIIDIIYYIALWCKFKKSIAIVSSCKEMWERRVQFYKTKQLLWYPNRPLLNFWTPEQQFYAAGCQFILSVDDITLYMETTNIYEYNNSIYEAMNDFGRDFIHTFNIINNYMVIWYSYENGKNNTWLVTWYNNLQDINDKIVNIKLDNVLSLKYSVIHFDKSVPCWTKWNTTEPVIYNTVECIFKDCKGKIHSGE
jgi:hypothetical protein